LRQNRDTNRDTDLWCAATDLFAFLQAEWPAVHAYKSDASLRLPYQDNLSALIHEPSFKAAVGEALFSKARLINQLGNQAKARAFLRAHKDHVAIHKLRMNRTLTASDLAELERMLAESGVVTPATSSARGASPRGSACSSARWSDWIVRRRKKRSPRSCRARPSRQTRSNSSTSSWTT